MLQSDDDRWPMFDTRYGSDEEPEKSDKSDAVEIQPAEHKGSDKQITTSKPAKPQDQASLKQELLRFANLGTELFAAVLVGTLIGWAISRFVPRYATIIIVGGVIIGAAAGFLNMYNAIIELERKEEQRKRGSSE